MKKREFLLLIIPLLMIFQCAMVSRKDKTYYSDPDLSIMNSTLEILDYGSGYDREMDLHYIYRYTYSDTNLNKKKKEFAKAIRVIDTENLISLYYKLLRVQSETEYKMSRYKEKYEWRYYTFIKNELYDPLDKYITLLHINLLKKDPAKKENLIKAKFTLQREVIESYVKDEEIIDTF